MKVKITDGTYGFRPDPNKPYLVRPVSAGGICEVTAEEGLRLIGLGVAVSAEVPPETVATPIFPVQEAGGGENTPEAEAATAPLETDEATVADLHGMKLAELKAIATQYGIDAGKMRSKAEVIAAIEAASDGLPDLTPEGPVV